MTSSDTPPSDHGPCDLAVTGSGGRIGGMLRRLWTGPDIRWLRRGDDLAAGFTGCRAVLGLAGVTTGDAAALAANTRIARDTLAAARAADVGRVLLFSSAAVYGRAEGPLREDRAPTPLSSYGFAKAEMEATAGLRRADGPEVTILRLGNVAGADALLSRLGETAPRLDTFPNGAGPRRSYIGPVSLAQVLAVLIRHPAPLPPVLNIAAPGAVDMADLLRAAGRDWVAVPAGPDAIPEVTLDTTLQRSIAPLPPEAGTADRIVAEWREVTA